MPARKYVSMSARKSIDLPSPPPQDLEIMSADKYFAGFDLGQ